MTVGATSRLTSRIRTMLEDAGIRIKILGMVLGLTVALGLSVTFQVRMMTTGVLEHETDLRGIAVASDLASHVVEPLLLGDAFAVHEFLHETLENHDDVVYAYVVDDGGSVSAHSFDDRGFPVELIDLPADTEPIVFDSELGRIRHFQTDVLDGRVGTVHIGLTEARLRSLVSGITAQMFITTLAIALIGIGTAVLLTRIIVRPIAALVKAAQQVGTGDLTARAPAAAGDEIGVLTGAFNQMVEDLETSQRLVAEKEMARARLLDELITAQEVERKRIARDLHDGIGQSLNSLVLGLTTLADDDGVPAKRVASLRRATLETLEMVREMSRQLRPSVLDDLGLEDALILYAAEIEALHPDVSVDAHVDLDHRLPPSVETALYRMIQEGLTNAARHSGGSLLSLVVARRNGSLRAIVEDNGSGFDVEDVLAAGRGVGLHAIRERAELVGGRADYESGPTGTTLLIEVPL